VWCPFLLLVQHAAFAKFTAPAEEEAPAAAAEAEAGETDPNALPAGWDYEYDGDGNIYFIAPDGTTTWDDPRTSS
jgi:hypothetical protein